VLENDCLADAMLDVSHPAAFDRGECPLPVGLYRDRHQLKELGLPLLSPYTAT
jgi:hypothetical protein